jgi:uncharacterized membrane protein
MDTNLQKQTEKADDGYQELSSKRLLMGVGLIAIVGFVLIIVLGGTTSNPTTLMAATQEGENLVISKASIKTTAKFYYYEVENVEIRFFAVKGTDDKNHLAFDACDVCFAQKKGYTQQNNLMRCINCGNTFLITGIGTENLSGGCWPSYLPITQSERNIYIKIADVTQKLYMFV